MEANARTRDLLSGWTAPSAGQERLRSHYLAWLDAWPGALTRPSDGGPPEHLTGSALVFDEAGTSTLLVHHAKGGFWVQPGGHWEPGDVDLAATARREAAEETGLRDWLGSPVLADLNRHGLPGAFGQCRLHDDVAFVLRTAGRPQPEVSEESNAVGWFPVEDLPAGVVSDLPGRIAAFRGTHAPVGCQSGCVLHSQSWE